jgi:tetratricopeptide (TPR) repeat protein
MRRSTDVPWLLSLVALLAVAAGGLTPAWAQSRLVTPGALQAPSRLIDLVDVDEHETQVDITLQFNCSLHYTGHTPASEGSEVRLRLRPDRDCGTTGSMAAAGEIPTEIPPISGPRGIVTSARLESSLGNEVTLTLTWAKPERFVLAQGASSRGLRIRLIRARQEKAKILVTDRGDTASNFAVNLESQREPFDKDAIERAGLSLQTKIFVSEITTAGEKWYRLRAGPFDQRSVAESVLRAAQKDYPRAWLAVGDDSVTTDPSAAVTEPPLPPVEPLGADPPMEPKDRQTLLQDARKAMRNHNYADAVQMLTKLQRQPEFPERAQVQELLGLARERAGEVAQAKAEYEEYLRRYPNGPAADRIRTRLRILRAAAANGRLGGLNTSGEEDHRWSMSGGVTQLYRRDSFGTDANGALFATIVEQAVFTDADFFARRDGERFDFAFRTNAGLETNLVKTPQPVGEPRLSDRTRVTTAFFDFNDKVLGLRERVGRQTATTDGIFGTFDGAMVSYQVLPSWTLRATAGSPIDNAADGPDKTHTRFGTLAVAYNPELAHWNSSLYVTQERVQGLRDRQAVGAEWQYLSPEKSVISYVDYDTAFHALNAAVLLATVQLPDRWQVTADLEHRNAPLLTTRNALLGQVGVTSVTQLEQTFTTDQIFQLARDRTMKLDSYILSALKQLGERFQVMLDVFATRESDLPASGGVEFIPGTQGTNVSYQVQLFGTGILTSTDFNQAAVRYDKTSTSNTTGFQYIARYPIFGAWRIGPRFLFQSKSTPSQGIRQVFYQVYGHLDYQRNGRLLEIEGGTELGRNPTVLQIGNTTRLFISVGYRVSF